MRMEVPPFLLRTDFLRYREDEGTIEIPGHFQLLGERLRLTGERFVWRPRRREGKLQNVEGRFQLDPLVALILRAEEGRIQGDTLELRNVRLTNYEPEEKAGARLRVASVRLHQGRERYADLERVQLEILGRRVVAVAHLRRSLTAESARFLVLPVVRYHRDSGLRVGGTYYIPLGKCLLGPGYEYSARRGGLPTAQLLCGGRLELGATFGEVFRENGLGRGSVVRLAPELYLRGRISGERASLLLGAGWASWKEGTIQDRVLLGFGRLRWEMTRFRRMALQVQAEGRLERYQRYGRRRQAAWSVRLETRSWRKFWALGYLRVWEDQAPVFPHLLIRKRSSLIFHFRRRWTPKWETEYYLDYALPDREVFYERYALSAYWRGLRFTASWSPQFRSYSLLLGLEGF